MDFLQWVSSLLFFCLLVFWGCLGSAHHSPLFSATRQRRRCEEAAANHPVDHSLLQKVHLKYTIFCWGTISQLSKPVVTWANSVPMVSNLSGAGINTFPICQNHSAKPKQFSGGQLSLWISKRGGRWMEYSGESVTVNSNLYWFVVGTYLWI